MEYRKFKLLPVLSEGRKSVAFDNRRMRVLENNAKSPINTKKQSSSIDSRYDSLDIL